jgi:hypothetical protein
MTASRVRYVLDSKRSLGRQGLWRMGAVAVVLGLSGLGLGPGCASSPRVATRQVQAGEVFSKPGLGVSFAAPPGEWTVTEKSDASRWLTMFGMGNQPEQGNAPETVVLSVAVERVDPQWVAEKFSSRRAALESRIAGWVETTDGRYTVIENSTDFRAVDGAERLVVHQVTEDRAHPAHPGEVLIEQTEITAGFSPRDPSVDYVVVCSRRAIKNRPSSVNVKAVSDTFMKGMAFTAPR